MDLNQISVIPNGALLTTLGSLGLSSNQISVVPDGAFDLLTKLTYLTLVRNQITVIPKGAFDQLTALQYLDLGSNQIMEIPKGAFDQLTALTELYFQNNKIRQIDGAIFPIGNAMLNILDISNNQISFVDVSSAWNPCVLGSFFYYNPNPLICSCNATSFICESCGDGSQVRTPASSTAFATCYTPEFGLNPTNDETKNKNNTLANLIGESALYVGALHSFNSVDFAPKEETFAGFTLSAELITFRLDFVKGKPGVDIGCGDIVIGDTLANGTQDLFHIDGDLYYSRETHLRFDVTIQGSVFVFDGCNSRFGVSLAVCNFGDLDYTIVAGQESLGFSFPKGPSCPLSASAMLTTPPLDVGSYVLVIQGRSDDDISVGGVFEVHMSCPNSTSSALDRPPLDPLGIIVDPVTGQLTGTPQIPGSYTVDYVAVDGVGTEATLATLDFEVQHIPNFTTSDTEFAVELAPNSEYKSGGDELLPRLTISTTYRYTVNESIYSYVTGYISNVSYRLNIISNVSDADDDILMNTATGTFQATPSAQYEALVEIIAVDDGGTDRRVVIKSWAFTSLPSDKMDAGNGPNHRGCVHGDQVDVVLYDHNFTCECDFGFCGDNCDVTDLPQLLVEYHGLMSISNSSVKYTPITRTQWALGTAYRIAPVNITFANNTLGDEVNPNNITYSLSPNPPGFFIDSSTGEILGQPEVAAPAFNATMYASAPETLDAVVFTIQFEFLQADVDDVTNGPNGQGCTTGVANDNTEFDKNFSCICTVSGFSGTNCENVDALPQLEVDEHGVQQLQSSDGLVVYTPRNRTQWAIGRSYRIAPVNITSANTSTGPIDVKDVQFELVPNPPGFFIDGSSGEILGQPQEKFAQQNATLYATVPGTAKAKLWNLTFDFKQQDIGLNSSFCQNGNAVDEIEFDGKYTCECYSGYTGEYCETAPAFEAGSNQLWELVGSVAVFVVCLVIVVVWRIQVYRLKNRPIDMGAIQLQLLADLGLSVSADIADTEVGVTITTVKLDKTADEMTEDEREDLESALLQKMQRRFRFQSTGSWIHAGPAPIHMFVVVFPKDVDYDEEIFARDVAQHNNLLQSTVVAINGYRITSAAIACLRRTPREISRKHILRIEAIGAGNFSDVFKGELSEMQHGQTMKVLTAVKASRVQSETVREDVLKEAVLMALFDHRNVLALIGVVTTPRDMSVLLVLTYCENGSLKDFLQSRPNIGIPTKLTFCAEVARGLDYISARRVVHRDVALRNILLDVSMVCKIADFGLAIALNESKEYARFAESNGHDDAGKELPIRWAAIEVLVDSKFSVQTDVWAFGVFVWEVFSNGVTPYEDLSLIEVVAHVKTGGQLPRLSEAMCSVDSTKIIEACTSPFPASRPTFRALYSDLIFLGGSEDDVAIHESKRARKRVSAGVSQSVLSRAEKLSRQGPSVHHLQTTFLSSVLSAVESELASFDGLKNASDAAIYHMVKAYGKPRGEFVTCPRDGIVGAAYVDTLNGVDDVGLATALLSYSWGYKVNPLRNTCNT